MTYPRCPKCGWMESFEDECPRCGVYASKYLAAQQRAMQAVHGATFSDSRPPPPGGFLPDSSVSLPPMAKGWNTQSIVVWSMVAVILGLVGWVVLVDWFGDACAYSPPPGWQAIDELNRAFAGQKDSGYSAPVHLVTPANIRFDGGRHNEYDPDNGYREKYRKIWGVK